MIPDLGAAIETLMWLGGIGTVLGLLVGFGIGWAVFG